MHGAASSVLRPLLLPALLGGLVLATLASLALDFFEPWLTASPLLLVCAVWAVLWLPVRYSALTLLFFVLAADCIPERPQLMLWPSPLFAVGKSLFQQLNSLTGLEALRLPGVDLWVLLINAVAVYRRAVGSRVDPPVTPLPRPLVYALGLVLLTVGWMQVYGLLRGGDVRQGLWQWHQLFMLPLVVGMFHFALRGPEDWPAVRRVVVAAAFYKAVVGAYFILAIARPRGYEVEFSTAHSDSMTFVFALLVAVTPLLERPSWRLALRAGCILAVVGVGMYFNDRRLAYVSTVGCLLTAYLMNDWTLAKRRVSVGLVALAPLLAVYVAVGWNAGGRLFGPVQTFKSVIEGQKAEGQMDYRDIENWDLIVTWRSRPLLGTGYGHVFEEPILLPNIAHVFPTYGFHPHNSLLGLLAFGGVVGFTGLWLYLPLLVFFAARAYHRTRNASHRESALVAIGMVACYGNQVFGDMGIISWIGLFLVGVMAAHAGKLAVAVGAWPREGS